jgi:Tol biopolymer transport system component
VAYSSLRDGVPTVFRRASDGSGGEESLYRHDSATAVVLTDWSRDGRFLTFWSGQGMFVLPLTGTRQPIAIADGRGARFSPDGRLLAYSAAEPTQAARFHAFVRPFDPSAAAAPAPARQLSQTNALGGITWRGDGKQIFFLSQPPGQAMMAVDLSGAEPSAPRVLFPLPPGVTAPAQLSNIGSPDGQRFVFAVPALPAAP